MTIDMLKARHPVGVHWVDDKRVVCREVAEVGVCEVCERIRSMEKQGYSSNQIFKIKGPKK
jgi:hypothetical protein